MGDCPEETHRQGRLARGDLTGISSVGSGGRAGRRSLLESAMREGFVTVGPEFWRSHGGQAPGDTGGGKTTQPAGPAASLSPNSCAGRSSLRGCGGGAG